MIRPGIAIPAGPRARPRETMTTTAARTARHHADQHDQARPDGQAVSYLAAVAARLAAGSITTTVEPIGGIPVLTAEEPAAGPDPATVSINPGTSPGGPAECTCIWTPGPGASPEATAGTIAAVLATIRTGQMGTSIRPVKT